MKTIFITLMFSCVCAIGKSQVVTSKVSDANWVIESNLQSPKEQIVKFYNSKQELIYEEYISGKRLRIEKRSVKKTLNKVLEEVLNDQERLDYAIVAQYFKIKNKNKSLLNTEKFSGQ